MESVDEWIGKNAKRITGTNAYLAVCEECGGAGQMNPSATGRPFLFARSSIRKLLEEGGGVFRAPCCVSLATSRPGMEGA
jgi:hypothetical protein